MLLYGIVWVVSIVWCRYSGIGQKYSVNESTGSREDMGKEKKVRTCVWVCLGVFVFWVVVGLALGGRILHTNGHGEKYLLVILDVPHHQGYSGRIHS